MNYGILHNRRPERGGGSGRAAPAFLQDARMREIARQMGLEAKDFGKDAMNLWNMLDEMAESDPKAYHEFINEQLKHGPPKKGPTENAFHPQPGYVVKCSMRIGVNENKSGTAKLFVNLCAHELVDMPKNPNSDRAVPRDTRDVPTTSNLQIPLVVGSTRTIRDLSGAECHAIDVVFHPWVMERCAWDASFKRDVLHLALTWIQEDAHIQLATPVGKFIKSRYKGGVSVGEDILTAKFIINGEQQQQTGALREERGDSAKMCSEETSRNRQCSTSSPREPVMSSPADLLKRINKQDDQLGTKEFLIAPHDEQKLSHTKGASPPELKTSAAASTAKKRLIEVIEPRSTDNQKEDRASQQISRPNKSRNAVKKGFLNASKSRLYPTGSSEGRPASSYVNLLSRSKVVDMNEFQQQHQQPTPEAKDPQEQNTVKIQTSSGKRGNEIDHADREFEQLCFDADPELVPPRSQNDDEKTKQLLGEDLGEFGKFFTSLRL